MKKLIIFITPIILALLVFLGFSFFLNRNLGKGGLQVTSNPKSQVFLNGKLIGTTPLSKRESSQMLPVGDYTIRLVPEDNSLLPFEEKIKITKSVLTVVDRTFGKGLSSEGSIITLSPLSDKGALELLVLSFPDNVEVRVDNNLIGTTPLLSKALTESDHEIKFLKDGYREKSIRIKMVAGYKLTVVAFLGVNPAALNLSPTAEVFPSATPAVLRIVILQTPTGFLRVRESNSLNSPEVTRVNPGEIFDLLDEQNGWFEIKLKDGKTGWISNQYAQKQ